MGRGVALNLAMGGYAVLVWDIAETARKRVQGSFDIECATPAEMAAACAVILMVVPTTKEIRRPLRVTTVSSTRRGPVLLSAISPRLIRSQRGNLLPS